MEKNSIIDKIAFYLISVFIVILPLFFIPSSYVAFAYGKVGLLTLGVFIPFILLLIKLIYKGDITLPWITPLPIVLAVPVFVAVSALLSHSPVSGLIGRGIESTTLYFIVLCFLLLILCAVYLQEKQKALYLYLGFLAAFALITIFSFARFIFGVHFLSFGLFTSIVDNTIGSWGDLGIYSGIAVIISLVTLEFLSFEKLPRIALYCVLVAGVIMVALANSYIVYDLFGLYLPLTAVVGIFAAVLFIYLASLNYRSKVGSKFKVPVLSLIVLIVSIVTTIWASPIVSSFYSYESVAPSDVSDVRPTLTATSYVAESMIKAGVRPALFGIGPNRFAMVWSAFKPVGVNEGDTWNTDFTYGVGYIPTTFITTGILGFLAWLCFLLYFFYLAGRMLVVGVKDQFSLYLILSSGAVSLYLWCVEFFYVTGVTITILAFVFTGLCIASIVRENGLPLKKFSWAGGHKRAMGALVVIILLVLAMMVSLSIWIDRAVASIDAARAVSDVSKNGDTASAENLLMAAIGKDNADIYLNLYSQVKLYELQTALQKANATTLDATTGAIYNDTLIAAVQAAQTADPYNYQNWLFLANVYEVGAQLGVTQSAQRALGSFSIAEQLAPMNPYLFYVTGQLYALGHDYTDARVQLEHALVLKSNYTDAQNLLDSFPSQADAATTTKTPNSATSTTTTLKK